MIESLNAAAAGLSADVQRLTTISQNLVHGATSGYKRELTHAAAFEREWSDAGEPGHDASPCGIAQASATDHRLGALRPTGNPLDLAIDGQGFFEVRAEGRTLYTRRGDFRLDAGGQLVTQAGEVVQGVGGPIQVPSAEARIDRDGRVFDGDKPVGQLRVVRFADTKALTRFSGTTFAAGDAAVEPNDAGRVRQGHLEASNVDTASEMVKLLETVRHFEATQKIVQGIDEMHERALRKLGEF